jgi:hypothetical protein
MGPRSLQEKDFDELLKHEEHVWFQPELHLKAEDLELLQDKGQRLD